MALVDYVKKTDLEIEKAKQQLRDPKVDDFDCMVAAWVKSAHLQRPAPTNYHIKATPLFELSSICIYRDNEKFDDVNSSLEIYGHVKLTNDFGKEFFLFNRAEDNTKTVVMLDSTSAVLDKSQLGSPRWLPQNFCLELFLVDKSRNITIFSNELLLDFTHDVVYDEELVAFLQSRDALISVHYTVFRCALLALVRLTVFKNENCTFTDGKDVSDVVVSGTVSTTTKLKGARTELLRMLFDEESLPLTLNDPALLPPLAVPVSSSFRINANLVVNGQCISSGDDGLEFEPSGISVVPFWKKIMGLEWCVEVSVTWLHSYHHFDEDEFHKMDNFDDSESEVTSSEDNENESSNSEDSEKESSENEKSTKGEDVSQLMTLRHRQLLEVFSISVCSVDDDCGALQLYGAILYKDVRCNHLLYKRDMEDLDIVYPHQPLLRLNMPCREIEEGCFEMHLDLKDDEGLEMSKGYLRWSHRGHWRDERICSVVPGEHGFACVHYAIFSDAFAAKVRVIVHKPFSPSCYVFGNVNARYGTHRYSNHYERKYYQSTLFRGVMKPVESVHLDLNATEIEVPLLKTEIAVPSDTPLIIQAQLHVLTSCWEAALIGEATFDPRNADVLCSKMSHETSSGCCDLKIEVEWIDS